MRLEIQSGLARALADAGRGMDAAEAFTVAAQMAPPDRAWELWRLAGEQWLISGYVARGLEALGERLTGRERRATKTRARALATLLARRALVRLDALKPPGPVRDDGRTREQIELFRSLAFGLAMVDTMRAAAHHSHSLRLALRSGDPVLVCRGLAIEAVFVASQSASAQRGGDLLAASRRAGAHLSPCFCDGWTQGASAVRDVLRTRHEGTLDRLAKAETVLREQVPGSIWEQTTLRLFRCMALRLQGNLRALGELMQHTLEEAAGRRNLYLETTLRRGASVMWLGRDEPERVHPELAATRWEGVGFHVQHFFELEASVEHDMYLGRGATALEQRRFQVRALSGSLLLAVQLVRVIWLWLRGRVRIHEAQRCASRSRRAVLLSGALSDAALLRREGIGHAEVWSRLLVCGALGAGGMRGAVAFRHALLATRDAAQAHQLPLARATVDRALAVLDGDGEGVRQAERTLLELGVQDPNRMARVVAPGTGSNDHAEHTTRAVEQGH